MKVIALAASAAFLGSLAAPASAVSVLRNYEAPGVQTTTALFSSKAVETFDGRDPGTSSFASFGGGTGITGQFTNARVVGADQYTAAGGTGNGVALYESDPAMELTLSTDDPAGVTYLGFWLSALNTGNTVTFFKGGTRLVSYDASAIFDGIANLDAYKGNPTAPFLGQNDGEPYAFVNFYFRGASFDRVLFTQTASGGLELDNVTVGTFTQVGGVPEPATWAMMILGFGMVGFAMRRRERMARVAA